MKYLVFISDTASLPTPAPEEEASESILEALAKNGVQGNVAAFTDLSLADYAEAEEKAAAQEGESQTSEEHTDEDGASQPAEAELENANEAETETVAEAVAEAETETETAAEKVEPADTEEITVAPDSKEAAIQSKLPFVDKWTTSAAFFTDDEELFNAFSSLSVTGELISDPDSLPLTCNEALAYYHITKELSQEALEKILTRLLAASLEENDVRLLVVGKDEEGKRAYILSAIQREPNTEENGETSEGESQTEAKPFGDLREGALVETPSRLLSALLGVEPVATPVSFADNTVTPSEEENNKEEKAPISHLIFEWIELFSLSLALVLIIMTIFLRHSPVSGSSMEPTLNNGDILLISRVGYTPERGDVVIVQTQNDDLRRPLVKRIIAVGGDTIRINFSTWEIFINGELTDEPYIEKLSVPMNVYSTALFLRKVDNEQPIYEGTVPEGKLFIMGDNRNNSKDSRTIGFVDEREVIGDVKYRLLPFDDAGKID